MVLNEKGNIKQFNLVIYPVDFTVVIGELEEDVNRLYQPYEEEYKDAYIAPPSSTGTTYRVRERETGIPCVLIWIGKINEFTSSIVAHECTHAALEIWNYIKSEVSLSNQEPFAYLLGNLVRLAVGCFYEIPGIKPPIVKKEAFENPSKPDKLKKKPQKKK
jgi:hypothetical protein